MVLSLVLVIAYCFFYSLILPFHFSPTNKSLLSSLPRVLSHSLLNMKSRVSEKSIASKTKLNVNKKQTTPIRSIFCLKNRSNLKEIEKKEDCFILDFNPEDSLRKLSVSNNKNADSADISVVAEKGQVACRDFPHSRHNCAKYPFNKTNHESCCRLCYCFVCDTAAPCIWSRGSNGHCHALNNDAWKLQRNNSRIVRKVMQDFRKANRF